MTMKKLLVSAMLLLSIFAGAQNQPLTDENDSIPSIIERIVMKQNASDEKLRNLRKINTHFNLEFASSAQASFTEGRLDEAAFRMNRVRFEMLGNINDRLSYHFRQAFNKSGNPNSLDNITSSIEYAFVTWHHKDKFDLVAGKQCLAVAGYENWVNGLKVREFSDFNDNYALFQTGITGVVKFTPDQHLLLQLANNRNGSDSDAYMYGLPDGVQKTRIPLLATASWNGWFADKALFLMYSASAGQVAKGKNMYYLMCGNVYEKGPILAYLDVLYARYGVDMQQRVTALQSGSSLPVTAQNTEYFTVIANFDYRFHPKWNGFIKGAYETAGVYQENGPFAAGKYMTSWNAQACLEWFPFAEQSGFKVFLHAIHRGYSLTDKAVAIGGHKPCTQRISLGIQYIIPVL